MLSSSVLLRMRNVSGKINTPILMYNNIFQKVAPLVRYCRKYSTAGEATNDKITRRMRIACWITEATNLYPKHGIHIVFHSCCG